MAAAVAKDYNQGQMLDKDGGWVPSGEKGSASELKVDPAKLFFTEAVMQGMSDTGKVRAGKVKYTLLDPGSEGNLVPRHVVQALRAKTIESNALCEMASGEKVKMGSMLHLTATVMNVS